MDDQETVRSGRGGSELPPPAVDPWPHAAPEQWQPDPDATVAGEPSWEQSRDLWSSPTSPSSPAGFAPPVSPASSGWGESPDRPASSTWPASSRAAEAANRSTVSRGLGADVSSRGERSAATRPTSPARPAPPSSARSVPGRTPSGQRPANGRPESAAWPTSPAHPRSGGSAARPPARRSGRFLRFVQILLSTVVLIVVPIAAMVLAYATRIGAEPRDAVVDLLKDLAHLLT